MTPNPQSPSIFTCLIIIVFAVCMKVSVAQTHGVGQQTLQYININTDRPLKTEVWYPTTEKDSLNQKATELPFLLPATIRNAELPEGKHPLVVLSHGTGGNRHSLAWLAIELVNNGFMVIAPDHWGNTFDHKIPENFVRYWYRPQDISFLLTAFLDDPVWRRHVDQDRIGMIGFSLGGYTALALGGVELDCHLLKEKALSGKHKKAFYAPELGDLRPLVQKIECDGIPDSLVDERFKAIVSMAPTLGIGLPDKDQSIVPPVLIIAAENDKNTPVNQNAARYQQFIPNSRYLIIEGKAGHYVFLNQAKRKLQKEAKRIYKDARGVDRQAIHVQLASEILSFLEQNLQK